MSMTMKPNMLLMPFYPADLATVSDCFVITMPSSKSISWLIDGDDTTCNTDPCVQAIKLAWSQVYWIRSIRLTVNDTGKSWFFSLTVNGTDENLLD